MESVSLDRLTRLLLQRSDRHPIGTLCGSELVGIDPSAITLFEQLGLLVETERLADADDIVFQAGGDQVVAISISGESTAQAVDIEELRQFEIDRLAVSRQLRRANGFKGPPVEAMGPRVTRVGDTGAGSRRTQYFLVTALRPSNALDTALAVRGRAARGKIVLLTPTERNLPNDVDKRLLADQIDVLALDDLLDVGAGEPLSLKLPVHRTGPSVDETDVRLRIDVEGMRCVFDSTSVDLAPREFRVLVCLANEAATEQGNVPRSDLYYALTDGKDSQAQDEQIEKSVSLLRTALARAGGLSRTERRKLITSKRKIGYRLAIPPEDILIY